MGARNAKKRHFQVEALEERLALDGTITTNTTMAYGVMVTDSSPAGFSIDTNTGSGNPNVTYSASSGTSTSVTVVSGSDPGQVDAVDSVLSALDDILLPRKFSPDEILSSADQIPPDEISPPIQLF